jgi:hypothetical protein
MAVLFSEASASGMQTGAAIESRFDPAIKTLLQAEPAVPGDKQIRQAWLVVAHWPPNRLREILDAAEVANPVALNWLRSAIDRMSEQAEFVLPTEELQKVAEDVHRNYASRRIALDLLENGDSELVASIVEKFVDDPIPAFRRPAIEKQIALADSMEQKSVERKQKYLEIFRAARDEDQVQKVAGVLEKDFGEKPDLADHFGFLLEWQVVGPFPNVDEAGFHNAYPPEKLTAEDLDNDGNPKETLTYEAASGTLRWQSQTAAKDTGELDLNKIFGKEKEVVGYGIAVFKSDLKQAAEIRLRMQNAFKLWLNGELLQSQPIGHTGNSFDQYLIPVTLKPGRNLILVKSCQNKPPMEMEFFDTWHINVRICDRSGTAITEGK